MTDIPRPKRYVSFYSKAYPTAWRDIDMFRANRGKGKIPLWPDWCFVTLDVARAVIAKKYLENGSPYSVEEYKQLADNTIILAAMSAWRVTQGIYRFDPDIYKEIVNTSVGGEIPFEALQGIPEWCVYIETPGIEVFNATIVGFFAALNYDIDTQKSELLLVLDSHDDAKDTLAPLAISIHLGHRTLVESIRSTVQESTKYWKEEWGKEMLTNSEEFIQRSITNLEPIVSLLLYLCSANSEIEPRDGKQPEKPQPKKTKRGPRLFPPNHPTTWDVGVRMGAAIRKAKTATEAEDRGGTHASPRPHVRRAHWHTYWTGPRKDPEKRKPILKWLSPVLIGGESKDMPVIIRKVKE